MMNKINIRAYEPSFRSQLRQICCDVADRGEPIERIFPDRDIAADLLTKYYTDYEPRSSFVAVCDGRLVGYINGCLDNRRYGLVMFWLLIPQLLVKAFKSGIFFKPQVLGMLKAVLENWPRIFTWRKGSFHSHQGHLHIGVASDFRHQDVGASLINALIEYAAQKGIVELEATVHSANKEASIFFEKQGFEIRARYPMVMVRDGQKERYQSLLYVRTISTI
ncbi:MAG: GNAT family N-acetyltransferase [Candidatus Omnitrophica bacterium]|nr:GNAT family N-acetyltransferase [Candidatus Omnitrophota bacterium]